MQDCECNLQKKRNENVFKMKFLMHKLLRENFGWDGCKTSHSKRNAVRKARTVSAKRFWHPAPLGIKGLTSTATGYNIMRGNRISFHSVAVKCLIAWSALLIGNTVQIRNSPRYCNTDGRSCMPLGFYLGRLCVPDDVKSGDLLPCFAITFGGKVRNNCCLNAFCAFCRQWRSIPCRFFYRKLQFCKTLSLYAERRACLRENHAAYDWWTSGFSKHME